MNDRQQHINRHQAPQMKYNFPIEVVGIGACVVFGILFVVIWSAALNGVLL